MSKIKIITLTMNPALDKSILVPQLKPDMKLRCQELDLTPGGGGINVARAIHHLGGEVKAVYPAGGSTGDMLEQLLEIQGVSQCRIKTKTWTRENLSVIEDISHNQYRFEMPGAFLDNIEIEQAIEAILQTSKTADFLVASGSLPPGVPVDFYVQLAEKLHGSSVKLIVDTSGEPLKKLKGSGVFLLKPNLREFREFTGQELLSEKEQSQAGLECVNNGTCSVLVLSLGPEGVLLITKDFQIKFRSPQVVVKSRNGAGDSTVAGIVYGLTQKMDLKDAVIYGICCGASTVRQPGNELCQKLEVKQEFMRMKGQI